MQNLLVPDRFDADRLKRLLQIVGPTEAALFLKQLDLDLSDCARTLADATGRQDWPALSEASHVLIALSGSVGALALQALAEALNSAAHAQDGLALAGLQDRLAPDLDRLIALVRATPDPFASPR
jgi:hypothetical protein